MKIILNKYPASLLEKQKACSIALVILAWFFESQKSSFIDRFSQKN